MRLLDLFCGAGGCSVGYHRAGFTRIVGVDHRPQPRYPFEFVQADALEYLDAHGRRFDVIHASPPCQKFSAMNRMPGYEYPNLIAPARGLLWQVGKPSVIENVETAPLLGNGVMLCGTMFNLRVRRHRLFEVSVPILFLTPPCQCKNGVRSGALIGHRCGGRVRGGRTRPPPATESDRRAAIGVEWMTAREARQAIPPAYTEWIGKQLMEALQ